MTLTFLLIPGAGGSGFFWHRLVPELARLGYPAVAADLPAGDEAAGFEAYAAAAVAAAGDARPVAVVAQSLGGFTAPLVCARLPVELLVFVNAMIPVPGETAGQWWEATGQEAARRAYAAETGRVLGETFDVEAEFLHDVPQPTIDALLAHGETPQAATPFAEAPAFAGWPTIPTHVIAGRDDRFLPAAFQRRVAEERLGLTPDVLPGGHLLALSEPAALAAQLVGYAVDAVG